MRSELKQFEGKTVLYSGLLKEWREHDEKYLNVCLTNVEVQEYKPDEKPGDQKKVKLDHFWLNFDLNAAQEIPRALLTRRASIGKVYYYTRSDGSLDLSIKSIKGYPLELIVHKVCEYQEQGCPASQTKDIVDSLHEFFEFYDSGDMKMPYHFYDNLTCSEIFSILRRKYLLFSRSYEADLRIKNTVKNYGKPKGLSLTPAFKNTRKMAAGFAA